MTAPTPVDALSAPENQSGPDAHRVVCDVAIPARRTAGGQSVTYRKRGPHIEVLEGRNWRRVNTIPARAVRVKPGER